MQHPTKNLPVFKFDPTSSNMLQYIAIGWPNVCNMLCPTMLALKYTWEISETSLAFLDIKVSIRGNALCTSVHYKPTDSHSYLLYSSSHPSHVKNSIPYSQFLRLRRLCSDDSDFSSKSEEMCQFFEKRGYPVSVVKAEKQPSSRSTI